MYGKTNKQLPDWVVLYKYDIGASVYMIGMCILARYPITFNKFGLSVLLIPAIFFINSVEHFFCMALLLSTLWGYFPGTWVGVFSVYGAAAALIMIRAVIDRRLPRPRACPLLILSLLCVTAGASWLVSEYSGIFDLEPMLILFGTAGLIGEFASFDLQKLIDALSRQALVLTLWYCDCGILAPSLTGNGRLSIAANLNVNTFGTSCAMLAVTLFLSFCFNGRKLWQLIGSGAALVLLILSGSRGALLGLVAACAVVLLLDAKRRYSTRRVRLVVLTAAAALLAAAIVLPLLGITRFRLSNLIYSAGTSDRIHMWGKLLTYMSNGGMWILGYGPGTACTRRVFLEIIDRKYYHAHNIFLEAFGEMGIGGLVLTAAYVLYSIQNAVRWSRTDARAYLLLGMAVYILTHGMLESFYQCFFFWAVLALCGSGYAKGDIRNEDAEGPETINRTISKPEG